MWASVHGNLMYVHRRHLKNVCFVVLFPLGYWRNQVGLLRGHDGLHPGWAHAVRRPHVHLRQWRGARTVGSACLAIVPKVSVQPSALGCKASKPDQIWKENQKPLFPFGVWKKHSFTKGGAGRAAFPLEMDSTVMTTERDKGPKNSFVSFVSSRLVIAMNQHTWDSLSFHSW